MPPKKGGDKKKAAVGGAEALLPEEFIANYKKACKLFGAPIDDAVVANLMDEEAENKTSMFSASPIGPGGVRAICAAILGKHPDFKPMTPFHAYTSLHFLRVGMGPDGCNSVAELLRLGGEQMPIQALRILDNRIGDRGCKALGSALRFGCNVTLKTLYLQNDDTIGDAGCVALCRGLRTNASLKRLDLEYCGIGPKGAKAVAGVIGYGRTEIEKISLAGNKIAGEGLTEICKTLEKNVKLVRLDLTDNCITGEDTEALETLRLTLDANNTLEEFLFSNNPIGGEGCSILAPALHKDANKNLKLVEIHAKTPHQLFAELNRAGGGGGKKKKGKKKK